MSEAKNKKSIYNKRYRDKNVEKIKQYYKNNKEHILKQQKEYRLKNKEKIQQYYKKYWQEKKRKMNETKTETSK